MWTSGNKDVDNCMKAFQIRAYGYEDVIEWIQFDRLSDIKEIGMGAFGSVYSAKWLDGIRKIDGKKYNYIRARETASLVALKTLYLKEFDNHMKYNFNLHGNKLKVYGITQNTKTNEYMMVFQYANSENLHKFIRTNFQDLNWQAKLNLLKDISENLDNIHSTGLIHANFHGGNVLQHKSISNGIQSYISDLELSKKPIENDAKGCIYGVMPYIAPEVLSGRPLTQDADIYAFGVIMSEMSTGLRPFDGNQFNTEFAISICNGLRPEFAPGTPEIYIKLAKLCMDSVPSRRPSSYKICEILETWNKNMENSNNMDKIRRQFLDADKTIKPLTITSSHPDHMYTSKIINTQLIAGGLKGYGKCERCNQNNTSEAWCQNCDPIQETHGWTSGNENVDKCIKDFQLKSLAYTKVIEWIPFERLTIIKKIGEGGFGSVYHAIWLDGIRRIDYVNECYVKTREPSSNVALKTLPPFEKGLRNLKEFKNHIKCAEMGIKLKVYGLTWNTDIKKHMMAAHYADNGNLHQFLKLNFKKLTWQTKLKLLADISEELYDIHVAGYIHRDFHSGNILLDKSMRTYISDLGLSIKEDENDSKDDIYGVLPYVAPEALLGEQFTSMADIYSFGIIMTEMSTGQRPFDGYEFDTKLAVKICNGKRPEFADETPNFYIELAEQCTKNNTRIRPTAYNIYNKLNDWLDKIKGSDYLNEVIKYKIKDITEQIGLDDEDEIIKYEISYLLDEIKCPDVADTIKKYEICYWFDKIKCSNNTNEVKEIIIDSGDIDEIKKQINYQLDKIKVLDHIDEIKKQINYWLKEIKDLDGVDEIKKQINNCLDKIKSSYYINESIKNKIKYWLDKMGDSYSIDNSRQGLDKIKNDEITSWYNRLKGADDKNEINELIDKIKGSDNIDKIRKHKIGYWHNKIIKGSKDKKQKYSTKEREREEKESKIYYWLNEIKNLADIDEIKKQIIYWINKIKGSENDKIKKQITYYLDKIYSSENIKQINEMEEQIYQQLGKIKGLDYINEVKQQINDWLEKIKNLNNIDKITEQFLESDKTVSELSFNSPIHLDHMYTSKLINTKQISLLVSKPIDLAESSGDSKMIDLCIGNDSFS
ncbi:kinase-like domain-containing protein [Gigaspora rosea]|uniref:Kinase-like domain-containing protein n=1 Tax=Gigaspora rosea TaxID=44941 RepID=A0A397W6W4_9GLOM|nr:kinase-like domain-containing protein [Gigaspora rosea]